MSIFVGLILLLCLSFFSWRYAWWKLPVSYKCPRIFMYHMIASRKRGARFNGLRVAPVLFEKQLGWLNKNGWKSFTVSELIEKINVLPEKSYAITFDDGYEDNYISAFPLLKKYNCKATLYLVEDRFNRDWSTDRKAHHNEGELKEEKKLSDRQVSEMLASGHFELGSHSITHANLLKLNREQAHREIAHSQRQFKGRFKVAVKSFAYPFGLYRDEHVAIVREVGYASAVTTHEGIEKSLDRDNLQLKRIKISGRDNMLAFVMRVRTGKRGCAR